MTAVRVCLLDFSILVQWNERIVMSCTTLDTKELAVAISVSSAKVVKIYVINGARYWNLISCLSVWNRDQSRRTIAHIQCAFLSRY